MASTSSTAAAQAAPWRASFLDDINSMESPELVFSTLHPAPSGSPTAHVPRARYCIYRGMWAELPENKHNSAPQNAPCFASDLPTLTTDVRMQKVFDLFASSSGKADDEAQVQGSGGGGPCEAVWWVKGERMKQWRIKGEAFLVGPDIEGGAGKDSSGVRTVKSEVGSRMRVVDEAKRESWSWQRELTAHFGNLSPGMRGSFKAPPPGQPIDEPYDDQKLQLGGKVEENEDEVASRHFRVVIIKPEEVESLDLSDPAKARRVVYKFGEGQWSETECWP